MTNPAPEPGQRVWIAGTIERDEFTGQLCIEVTPIEPGGTLRLTPHAVVWHPADVPPQPPVLAPDPANPTQLSLTMTPSDDWRQVMEPLLEAIKVCLHEVLDERGTLAVLAAPQSTLADERSPDDATPTPEPDETQTGAQGAELPEWEREFLEDIAAGRRDSVGHPIAVQGAGRDWRGELVKLINWVLSERDTDDTPQHYLTWEAFADERVAALGLHDLEQTAAKREQFVSQLADAFDREGYEHETDLILQARALHLSDALAADELARFIAERDAARRELEQLRGEVVGIYARAEQLAAEAAVQYTGTNISTRYGQLAALARAALAATAPATQDSGTGASDA